MSLTRKMLKAMGIEDEKIEQIIDAHTETTDALKKERDSYKDDAAKLAEVQKELDEAKKKAEAHDTDPYKDKYEKEHKEFEDFKKGVEAEKLKAKKVTAYKELLKKANVSEKRYDAIIRIADLDAIELDDKGEVKDADKAVEAVKTEWADYIVTERVDGAGTENPPNGAGAGGGKTPSRAAQIVAKHNEMVYGVKGENK